MFDKGRLVTVKTGQSDFFTTSGDTRLPWRLAKLLPKPVRIREKPQVHSLLFY